MFGTHFSIDIFANRPVLSAYVNRIRSELGKVYNDWNRDVVKFTEKYGGVIPGFYDKRGDDK
jgi:hypothetical protein